MSVIPIASNDFYEVSVDPEKNRMYLRMICSWRTEDQVKDWLIDQAEALKHCSPGLTVLIDSREFQSFILTDFVEKGQRMAMEAGLRKAARVIGETFAKVQLEATSSKTGLPVRVFTNLTEAEAWLDEP